MNISLVKRLDLLSIGNRPPPVTDRRNARSLRSLGAVSSDSEFSTRCNLTGAYATSETLVGNSDFRLNPEQSPLPLYSPL